MKKKKINRISQAELLVMSIVTGAPDSVQGESLGELISGIDIGSNFEKLVEMYYLDRNKLQSLFKIRSNSLCFEDGSSLFFNAMTPKYIIAYYNGSKTQWKKFNIIVLLNTIKQKYGLRDLDSSQNKRMNEILVRLSRAYHGGS